MQKVFFNTSVVYDNTIEFAICESLCGSVNLRSDVREQSFVISRVVFVAGWKNESNSSVLVSRGQSQQTVYLKPKLCRETLVVFTGRVCGKDSLQYSKCQTVLRFMCRLVNIRVSMCSSLRHLYQQDNNRCTPTLCFS